VILNTKRGPYQLEAVAEDGAEPAEVNAGGVTELETEESFDALVAGTDKLVVLNCGTTWCGPCKVFAPVYDEISAQFSDATFVKVVGDKNASTVSLMKRLNIRAVPSFRMFRDGVEVDTHSGTNRKSLTEKIQKNLKPGEQGA